MKLEDMRAWYESVHQSNEEECPIKTEVRKKSKNWINTVDPWIRPLIEYLNTFSGCATLCSCAGKGPKGSNQDQFGKWHKVKEGYIFLHCRDTKTITLILMAAYRSQLRIEFKEHRYIRDARGRLQKIDSITIRGVYRDLKKFHKNLQMMKEEYESFSEIAVDFPT